MQTFCRHFQIHILLKENYNIWIQISFKLVPKGQVENQKAMIQVMAWHQSSAMPLSEAMIFQFMDAYMYHLDLICWRKWQKNVQWEVILWQCSTELTISSWTALFMPADGFLPYCPRASAVTMLTYICDSHSLYTGHKYYSCWFSVMI